MKRVSKEREEEILGLINKGLSNYEIRKVTNAGHKLVNRIRFEHSNKKAEIGERKLMTTNFTAEQIKQWNYLHERYGKKQE